MTLLRCIPGCTRFAARDRNSIELSRRRIEAKMPIWNKVFLGCVLGFLGFSTAATAAGGNASAIGSQAGDFGIKLKALGVFPENSGSSIQAVGGKVDVSNRLAPEIDFYYYFTDHIATQLIATLFRPSIKARGTAVTAVAPNGDLDVGATTMLPPTLTLQYHFAGPHSAFNPYLGAGVSFVWLFATNPSRGQGVVNDVSFRHVFNPSAAVQAGVDYNISRNLFLNFEVNQIFLSVDANVDTILGRVRAKDDINPFLVGFGAGYRF